MFNNCTGLKLAITELPKTLNNIGIYSFQNCTGLVGVFDTKNYTTIREGTFVGCTGITEVIVRENISTLGKICFKGCTNIKKLTIPISFSATGANSGSSETAFYGVNSIKQFYFTKGTGNGFNYGTSSTNSYDRTPWYYARGISGGITVTFENGIQSIGNYMFKNCTGLKNINYNNTPYNSSTLFKTAFETNGRAISSSAFTDSGF